MTTSVSFKHKHARPLVHRHSRANVQARHTQRQANTSVCELTIKRYGLTRRSPSAACRSIRYQVTRDSPGTQQHLKPLHHTCASLGDDLAEFCDLAGLQPIPSALLCNMQQMFKCICMSVKSNIIFHDTYISMYIYIYICISVYIYIYVYIYMYIYIYRTELT